MRCALLVVAVAGCNAAFGLDTTQLVDAGPDADLRPDLDHDHIADEEDPCIATDDDLAFDSDSDTVANRMDSCALLFPTTDTDGDGVDDLCDMFPTTPGDRALCTMAFRNPELTVALWKPRGEQDFAVARGFIIGPGGADIAAIEPIMPPDGTTTIDSFAGSVSDAIEPFVFELVLSAGDTPTNSDLACIFLAGTANTAIGIQGATQMTATAPQAVRTSPLYTRAIIQPGKAGINVVCAASFDTSGGGKTLFAYGHYDGPLKRFGLAVPAGGVLMTALAFVHRDDQPPLQ